MSQDYPVILADGSGEILEDLVSIIARTEALRSGFGGTSAPSSPVVNQLWKDESNDLWMVCESTGPDVWVEYLPFLLREGGTITGKLRMAEGAAIASAATVNLDTPTGNCLHITGTTNISAFTLAQGTWMLVCFDGILTVTDGANLVTQSGENIVTAAGDMALLVGEGSSVTRMVGYFRADGSPVHALLAAIAGLNTDAGVLYQTGAGAMSKRALGVATSADILTRAHGDARFQAISDLLAAIAADADPGLIEQTSDDTVTKRGIGVATATDVPTRADAGARYLRQGNAAGKHDA